MSCLIGNGIVCISGSRPFTSSVKHTNLNGNVILRVTIRLSTFTYSALYFVPCFKQQIYLLWLRPNPSAYSLNGIGFLGVGIGVGGVDITAW